MVKRALACSARMPGLRGLKKKVGSLAGCGGIGMTNACLARLYVIIPFVLQRRDRVHHSLMELRPGEASAGLACGDTLSGEKEVAFR